MIAAQLQPGEIGELVVQDEQAGMNRLPPEDEARLIAAGPSFAIRSAERLIFVGGIVEVAAGRARCWSLIAALRRREFVPLTDMVRRVIDAAAYRRTEMEVRSAFVGGHTWARHLGFIREGTMQAWGPDGQDYDLYARLRVERE